MKKRIFGIAGAIALLLFEACSNDTLDPNKNQNILNTDETSGGVYLAVDFMMSNGKNDTRSETLDPDYNHDNPNQSSSGEEVGNDSENFVGSALIVIAATEDKTSGTGDDKTVIKKNGLIVAGEVPSNRILTTSTTDGNKQYKAIARLQKENLNTFYTAYSGAEKIPEVYVFVFSNPTVDLLSQFNGETKFGSDSWINKVCDVVQGGDASINKNVGIWGTNSFLMNNVSFAKRELPKQLLDWDNFSTVDKPFHLSADNPGSVNNGDDPENGIKRGPVLVERSVARFDFKDGSGNNNTYSVLFNTNENGDPDKAQPIVDVQIQKMCLVNMSNKFYYIPRVSPDGYEANAEFFKPELPWTKNTDGLYTGGNYVVGPYASVFGGAPLNTDFSNYFNFPFFENNGSFNNEQMSSDRWDVVKVEDVLNGTTDNYKGVDGSGNPGQYRIWRYVTENVIPSGSIIPLGSDGKPTGTADPNKQVNGISTGVVFKAKLQGGFKEGVEYYEEKWNEGAIENLSKCLDGQPFKYNGENVDQINGSSTYDPILYYYSGHLYMGWRHIRQAAIQASVTINTAGHIEINRSNSLYKAVFGDGPIPPVFKKEDDKLIGGQQMYVDADGGYHAFDDPQWDKSWPLKGEATETTSDGYLAYLESANYAWSVWADDGKELSDNDGHVSEELEAMRAAVTAAGITIFQSSVDDDYGAGYYCYYYYWNRHNDNGLNGSMGPMEFAVVRNNVYKLSVDGINRLGHPRIPENDPNNPVPETPDESDEIYLDVSIKIVPWVVRVNSIIF